VRIVRNQQHELGELDADRGREPGERGSSEPPASREQPWQEGLSPGRAEAGATMTM
jgi:hypothetical protein